MLNCTCELKDAVMLLNICSFLYTVIRVCIFFEFGTTES